MVGAASAAILSALPFKGRVWVGMVFYAAMPDR
jgi:Flp pilus assembly protein TadB